MNSDQIEKIQKETRYPNSGSVQDALMQVWNEVQQENNKDKEVLEKEIIVLKHEIELYIDDFDDRTLWLDFYKTLNALETNANTITENANVADGMLKQYKQRYRK